MTIAVRIVLALAMAFAAIGRADDTFYRVPLPEVKIVEGQLPKPEFDNAPLHHIYPYAVLDGPGDVYLGQRRELAEPSTWPGGWRGAWQNREAVLVARTDSPHDLTGWMFVPDAKGVFVPVKFAIPASAAAESARREFFLAKSAYYAQLLDDGVPGAAFFRRETELAWKASGHDTPRPQARRRPGPELDDTYDLFSGGRAISDNLQLTRGLPPVTAKPGDDEEKPVAVKDIEGITVQSLDWPDTAETPMLDPLAMLIPADQHAVFFPSFDALMALSDAAARRALPAYRALSEQSEDGAVLERYETQLGLHASAMARALGPQLVQSVAITGSDPYFPTGTDVTILFQTPKAEALRTLLLGEVRTNSAKAPGVASEKGTAGGLPYERTATPDRSVCSYVAALNETTVVVANSKVQIERLGALRLAKAATIATLPEYRFFRSRYPRGANDETGFLFLSDATIRRWCGPEWRIGASRRLRAAAILADAQAANLDAIASGAAERPTEPPMPMRTIGTLTLGPGGVRSSVYGSLAFITPIAELGITEVTPDEAAAYKRWRDTYQENWRWAFDPIALSFSVKPDRISADLTVMPLILASGYKMWAEITKGVTIAPDAGDPHEVVAQAVIAVNAKARVLNEAIGAAKTSLAPGVEIATLMEMEPPQEVAQRRAWANIPILNEWKRRYQGRDPVEFHRAVWGTTLADPAGGSYRWNEKFRTMESVNFGHPAEPREGPVGQGPFDTIAAADFGITLEERGVRARVLLQPEPAHP